MKNIMQFENGTTHVFTADEMKELKKIIGSAEGNSEALQNLKLIFLEYLD
ncbi:hypothetical protein [Limosilactobacillus reuteri]|nr:hypothetical protein [Limosilactobacillus reuteri]QQR14603.1 hypothetical protein I5Q80_09390 [Limosilactobacillus reuteri]